MRKTHRNLKIPALDRCLPRVGRLAVSLKCVINLQALLPTANIDSRIGKGRWNNNQIMNNINAYVNVLTPCLLTFKMKIVKIKNAFHRVGPAIQKNFHLH